MSDETEERRVVEAEAAAGVQFLSGSRYKMIVTPECYRARMFGMHFETDKCFLLPSAMNNIQTLKGFYDKHPGCEVLVVGHTDRAGSTSYNLPLSVERAESMGAFLTDKVDDWMAWFGSGKPSSKRWGTREVQHMLTALPHGETPFYAGTVDGISGPGTKDAIKRFQAWSNENKGSSLTVDGVDGEQTRKAMVEAYMAIDNTSLPAGTTLKTHGCGEFHPEVETADGEANDQNRRVEIFLFDGPIDPPPTTCAAPGCSEYEKWKEAIIEEIDLETAGLPVTTTTVEASILSLTFRSDHLDDGGKKLLRPSAGDYKDAAAEFAKPEWDKTRSGCYPISQTKKQKVKLDISIEVKITPEGGSAQLTEVKGTCDEKYLCFSKTVSESLSAGVLSLTDFVSEGELPEFVSLISGKQIQWKATIDGEEKDLGSTGPHTIYVTFDQPKGSIDSPTNNKFTESSTTQSVTEERLQWAVEAAEGKGKSDEKECVDAVFNRMTSLGIGYYLGRRWVKDANTTGIEPKPTLHHYLWRCNANTAKGECHNIAASFALGCKILGIKNSFEIGYMYPWTSRSDTPPSYPKRGDQILGRYNQRCTRSHSGEGHGTENLLFLDGRGKANNFEGVAKYKTGLYAIGDARYDLYSGSDENASSYYARHDWDGQGGIKDVDLSTGGFQLVFYDTDGSGCDKPYPFKTGSESPLPFYWHE